MKNNLIFDLGAHHGKDTGFYLRKGFKVIAIEANPYCCERIRKDFDKYIKSEQLILSECALVDDDYEDSTVEFLINFTHHDWGTLDSKWNEQYGSDIEKVRVFPDTLSAHLSAYGTPYYLKIDIEGADGMCIRQLKGRELPKYISAELLTFNNILGKNVDCLEVIQALLDVGYTKFQLVDQGLNYKTKCPNPSKEGKYVNYTFDGYTSGLFGEDLSDNWTDIDDILFKYIHYFYKKPNCVGESLNDATWYDIHATT